MIRVVIASAAAERRAAIAAALDNDGGFAIVGEAQDGAAVVDRVRRLAPNVIVMDAVLPRVDAAAAISRIMSERPTPIVILASGGAAREVALALEALRAGALTVTPPPPSLGATAEGAAPGAEFAALVAAMAELRVVRRWRAGHAARPRGAIAKRRIVAMAASTGGPAALQRILAALPADYPLPILIVQHMTCGFVDGLAAWLDDMSAVRVKLAEQGETLAAGTAYVAPDACHLELAADATIALSRAPPVRGLRPSADVMFHAAARVFSAAVIAVILTGMGEDGIDGLRAVRGAGGRILVQDAASSVVFGMPRAAIAAGLADDVLPLAEIAPQLERMAVG